jgi:hypothetical protein
MMNDRILLRLAGEQFQFLYNRHKQEVYNALFPGIPIVNVTLHCGLSLNHDALHKIILDKIEGYELALAKADLAAAIHNFNDYGIS